MWEKIKAFFKKFWYVCLVPIGLFIVHLLTGSKRDAKLEEREKIQKQEIKEDKKEIKKTQEVIKKDEKEVAKKTKETKKAVDHTQEALDKCNSTIKKDLKDKAIRDEKANKYLPNL